MSKMWGGSRASAATSGYPDKMCSVQVVGGQSRGNSTSKACTWHSL